jgi:hypothetical protein
MELKIMPSYPRGEIDWAYEEGKKGGDYVRDKQMAVGNDL